MKSAPFPFYVEKKHHRHIFDVFIMHGYAWKFHLSQFGGTSSWLLSFCTRTKIADEEATNSPMGSIIWSDCLSMDWMSRDMLEMSTPTRNHQMFLENRNDVCFDVSWHIELHMVVRLNMIWPHIEEFNVWWESLINVQFGMGRDEIPMWWYDFHNLIFMLYNDKILLFLLMVGRR